MCALALFEENHLLALFVNVSKCEFFEGIIKYFFSFFRSFCQDFYLASNVKLCFRRQSYCLSSKSIPKGHFRSDQATTIMCVNVNILKGGKPGTKTIVITEFVLV